MVNAVAFLGITGTLQAEQGVVHLIAERLYGDPGSGARQPAPPAATSTNR